MTRPICMKQWTLTALAGRYGIQSIPVQAFFDASGQEVFRHTGFYPEEEVMKQLKEIGVAR